MDDLGEKRHSGCKRGKKAGERGSALVYILIAIALLAALTVAFMSSSNNQVPAQKAFQAVSEIQSQVDLIRATLQECVLLHSKGDGKAIADGAQFNQPYPLMPDDSYLDTCVADPAEAAGTNFVSLLRCPGDNPGPVNTPTEACHTPIFGGITGKFLPPPPDMFGQWRYYSGPDGVFIWIDTDKTDAFLETVMEKLDNNYSECEADIVDTSQGGGGNKNLDNAGNVVCTHGANRRLCFRVRLITRGTAVWNGDSGGDEAGC